MGWGKGLMLFWDCFRIENSHQTSSQTLMLTFLSLLLYNLPLLCFYTILTKYLDRELGVLSGEFRTS